MKTKLLYLWESLRSSFWFVPSLIILTAFILAFTFIQIDSAIDYQPRGYIRYFYSGGGEAARNILSTIAGAMLGVAGTVFSITLVVLTLASSQFGPRLLRNFMKNQINQVVLGTYVATFIYCLLILRTVKTDVALSFTPNISISFALIASLANIILLILFIHHTAVSIQADTVIADVEEDLDSSIKKLIHSDKDRNDDENYEKEETPFIDHVMNVKNGYLQAIAYEDLLKVASSNNLQLKIDYRPGDFLVAGTELVKVHCYSSVDEAIMKKVLDTFIIGRQRTPTQDVEFAIHQMVEIAARALSPGINDPFTAITCIDKLGAALCSLTQVNIRSPYWYDHEGKLRIISRQFTFAGIADAAFNQIRQYAEGNPSVMISLMDALHVLSRFAHSKEQMNTIIRHTDMVFRAGKKSFTEPNDLNDLRERYDATMTLLKSP